MAVPVSMVEAARRFGRLRQPTPRRRRASPVLVLMDEVVAIGQRVNMVMLDLDQLAGRALHGFGASGRRDALR